MFKYYTADYEGEMLIKELSVEINNLKEKINN
jgi:hypothetical protein